MYHAPSICLKSIDFHSLIKLFDGAQYKAGGLEANEETPCYWTQEQLPDPTMLHFTEFTFQKGKKGIEV